MNNTAVKQLKDKAIVPSVEGTLTKVYQPTDPDKLTGPQKSKGIHPQGFEITDSEGVTLKGQIIKQSLHLPGSSRNQKFRIQCGQNDDGSPIGIRTNIYNGEVRLEIGSGAIITMIGSSDGPTGQLGGVGPIGVPVAQPQARSSAPTRPTIDDHEHTLATLMTNFAGRLEGRGLDPYDQLDLALRAATTIYIQVGKENLISKQGVKDAVPAVQPLASPKEIDPKSSGLEFAINKIIGLDVTASSDEGRRIASMIEMGLFTWESLFKKVVERQANMNQNVTLQPFLEAELAKIKAMLMSRGESPDDAFRIACLDYRTLQDCISDKALEVEMANSTEDKIPF